jgi:hypothetical protein
VRVFIRDAADHGRGDAAVGERPVGDGKGGVFGGNERAGTEEEDRPGDYEQRIFVDTRVIRRFHEFRAPSRNKDYSAPTAAMFGLLILNRGEFSTDGEERQEGGKRGLNAEFAEEERRDRREEKGRKAA